MSRMSLMLPAAVSVDPISGKVTDDTAAPGLSGTENA